MERQTEPSDGELYRRGLDGDRAAFARLVDRHKDALVRHLYRLTRNHERAEDLAQEAFLRLYAGHGRYRERGHFRAYLFRTALNLLRSQERRSGRWSALLPLFARSNGREAAGPQQELLRGELRSELEKALAHLPLTFRAPLVLREVEGWPYRDIAELLRCREGTVKSRVHRGKRILERRLAPYLHEGAKP